MSAPAAAVATLVVGVPAALVVAVAIALIAFSAAVARRNTRLVPPVGRFVTVAGVRLHYVDQGAGPAVLMLHGLASQLQTFTYALVPLLAPGHRVIAVDRPGCGHSQAAADGTLSGQASLMRAFLDALGVERALVVGHSLGGMLALAMAIEHPDRVAGLALIAPVTRPQAPPPSPLIRLALRSAVFRWLASATIATPLAMRHSQQILTNLFAPDPVALDFATRGGAMLAARPSSYRNAARDISEFGGEFGAMAARYGELAMPVGVLFGQGDRVLDPALHGETLRGDIEGVDLDLIAGGHMIPLTAPERCAALIEATAVRAGLAAQPSASEGQDAPTPQPATAADTR